jgi:hypothetical protein
VDTASTRTRRELARLSSFSAGVKKNLVASHLVAVRRLIIALVPGAVSIQ